MLQKYSCSGTPGNNYHQRNDKPELPSFCSKRTMALITFASVYMLKVVRTTLQTNIENKIITCFLYPKAEITLKCLSIGTPKIIYFPFVSNEKLMFFRGPNIQAHCNEAVLCLNFGTPENNEFSIWEKWKNYYFRCPNT